MTTPPPLPAADPLLTVVDRNKLAPDVAAMVDPATPLPAGVQFFERRHTAGAAVAAAAWAVGLAGLGLLSLAVGVSWAIETSKNVTVYRGTDLSVIGFGLVCLLGTWILIGTARERLRLRGEQAAGRATRVGLFLTPAALIDADASSWTIVPRRGVGEVDGGAVQYTANGQTKRIALPAAFVGIDGSAVDRATVERIVAAWRGDGTA